MNPKQTPEFHLNRWLFGLVAASLLLSMELLSAFIGDYILYMPSLPLFIFPSLTGIFCIYVGHNLKLYRTPATRLFIIILVLSLAYFVLIPSLAINVFSSFKLVFLVLFVIAGIVIIYLLESRLATLSGLGQALLFLFIFIFWSILSPETKVIGNKHQVWVWLIHFTALALSLGLGYRGVVLAGMRPRRLGLGAGLLFVLAILLVVNNYNRMKSMSPREFYRPVEASGKINSRPNTIVIVLDTLRKDHLSLYGYNRQTSPFLEEWSKECQVFSNAVSSSPWTIPSHASLFTGLFPRSHGAHIFIPETREGMPPVHCYPLGPSFTTLAEIFKENGFDTAAFVANSWGVSKKYGLDQGFDLFEHGLNRRTVYARSDFIEFLACRVLDLPFLEIPYMLADEVTMHALELTQKTKGRPFFLFLNFMETHCPYSLPISFRDSFPGRKRGLFMTYKSFIDLKDRVVAGGEILPHEKEHLISQYDSSILYFDESLRKLIQGLNQQGLLNNTYIYFLSDHGESFGDHGYFQHSNDVYENEIAIPLLIRHPGLEKTGRIEERVFIVDLLPTILLNSGINPPENIEGVPIPEAVKDKTYRKQAAFTPLAELYYTLWDWYFSPNGDRFNRIRRAIYRDGFKVIISTDGKNEVYDLGSDPGELNNLVSTRTDLLREAESEVNRFLDMTVEPEPAAWPDIDQEDIELMKALGYIR